MRSGRALQILACIFAFVVLARVAIQADVRSTWRAVSSAGPFVLLALVPFAIGMAFDALGAVALLRALGHRTSLARMFSVRIASEALHISLPAGFVAADAMTAVLLQKRCGIPVRDGVVASIARKWLVMRSHAFYIVAGASAGFFTLSALAAAMHVPALPWIVLGSATAPLVLSMGLAAGLLGTSTFAKLHAVLARVPSERISRWLDSRKSEAVATDGQVLRLRASRGATAAATVAFVGAWCFEALESALLLRLVGAHVDLVSVFAVEAGLSMVRSLVAFLPSGLGVVDLGYATVIHFIGVEAGASAAFVMLRRAKEVVWVTVGYSILTALRRGAPMATTVTPEAREDVVPLRGVEYVS